jgi:hypothetical protein
MISNKKKIIYNDIEKEKKLLKDYEFIDEDDYKKVKEGNHICYYTPDGNFRKGGILIKNYYPELFILKAYHSDFVWSININNPYCIYTKPSDNTEELKDIKEALLIYDKIKSGEMILMRKKDYDKLLNK